MAYPHAAAAAAAALAVLDPAHPGLVLDLARVASFDSSGLSALIGIYTAVQERGGTLALTAVPDHALRRLHLTG
ncbi:STAS domain-containing protein [Streptomyces sp. H10-C2]|nr:MULTISPECIES: STAS domain-containing protein [unclassified Streptomyces]MDJ0347572.1 STAS domain-containing protein [Streptomyces sp. PH10-H1]MDJ0375753.1 STAS domain-containing protein [Streptomyces sp. H10-C2]